MHRVSLQQSAGIQVGCVELRTLLVEFTGDYTCDPSGILSLKQIRDLCRQLRHMPQTDSGSIGAYGWIRVT